MKFQKSLACCLVLFFTIVVALADWVSAQAGPDRMNVLFIMADDLGWRDLSCNGSAFYETPHIDSLARSGMGFASYYAANPLCSPTRASIMTGQYPARVGITAPV